MGDQNHIGENLRAYVQGFSPAVRDIFERFELHTQIYRLAKANLVSHEAQGRLPKKMPQLTHGR